MSWEWAGRWAGWAAHRPRNESKNGSVNPDILSQVQLFAVIHPSKASKFPVLSWLTTKDAKHLLVFARFQPSQVVFSLPSAPRSFGTSLRGLRFTIGTWNHKSTACYLQQELHAGQVWSERARCCWKLGFFRGTWNPILRGLRYSPWLLTYLLDPPRIGGGNSNRFGKFHPATLGEE